MPDFRKAVYRASDMVTAQVRPVRDKVADRYPVLAPYVIRKPAMRSISRQRAYWTDPETALAPGPYAAASVQAILRSVEGLQKADPILEIGSGLGATLAALVEAGFTNVTGVEINQFAVDAMRKAHPQLASTTVLVGPAEDLLADMEDDSFKLIIGVRTLQHVHPDTAHLFGTMGRLASNIVTIDEPGFLGRYRFPWDFEAEFAKYGFVAQKKEPLVAGGTATSDTVLTLRRMPRQESLHDFWTQKEPQGNEPASYVSPVGRSAALLSLISDLPKTARILEVGCNVGRNLAYLYDHGYTEVSGVEINPHAVELLRKTFPQLGHREVHVGAAGEYLPELRADSYDLVFTMGVLTYLHPDEAAPVFDDMVRISPDVLAIEPQRPMNQRQLPHDVSKAFKRRGMRLVSTSRMNDVISDPGQRDMPEVTAYRFTRAHSS